MSFPFTAGTVGSPYLSISGAVTQDPRSDFPDMAVAYPERSESLDFPEDREPRLLVLSEADRRLDGCKITNTPRRQQGDYAYRVKEGTDKESKLGLGA